MRAVCVVVAFIAGAVLYQSAVVLVGGALVAIAIPKAYFDWFGRPNHELALALLQFTCFALPVGLLVAGGTLSIQRLLSCHPIAVLSAILGGLIACFAFWVAVGVLPLSTNPQVAPYSPEIGLKQLLLPQWWAVSGFLAPWLGFALAAWLVLRRPKREA